MNSETPSEICDSPQISLQKVVVFASLIALAVLGASACTDSIAAGDWTFESDAGAPGPGPDTGTDTSTFPDDTFSAPDTESSPDSNDGDPRELTTTGWYRGQFEQSLFARRASVEKGEGEAGCRPTVRADGERWWITASSNVGLADFGQSAGRGRTIGKVRATGTITPRGEYGHLGAYDRRFDPDDIELLACETSKKLGSCVVPRPEDRCLHAEGAAGNETPTGYRLQPTVQTHGPDAMTQYELQITWKDRDGTRIRSLDTGFRIAWNVETDEQTNWYYTYDVGSRNAAAWRVMVSEYDGQNDPSTYENIDGWIRLLDDPRREQRARVKLSLEGTASDGSTIHIWGTFRSTRTGTTDW